MCYCNLSVVGGLDRLQRRTAAQSSAVDDLNKFFTPARLRAKCQPVFRLPYSSKLPIPCEKGGDFLMAMVTLRPNESQDQLLKRFRKKVVKSGVLSTVRRKRWFVSKSEQRRVEKKKSMRRIKRRQYLKAGND